jgi:hypothetical protein
MIAWVDTSVRGASWPFSLTPSQRIVRRRDRRKVLSGAWRSLGRRLIRCASEMDLVTRRAHRPAALLVPCGGGQSEQWRIRCTCSPRGPNSTRGMRLLKSPSALSMVESDFEGPWREEAPGVAFAQQGGQSRWSPLSQRCDGLLVTGGFAARLHARSTSRTRHRRRPCRSQFWYAWFVNGVAAARCCLLSLHVTDGTRSTA